MNKAIPAAVASAFLAFSAAAFAQATTQDPANPTRYGESPRCDAMSGEAREQCLRDENTKTESAPATSGSDSTGAPASGAATGDSSTPPASESSSGSSAPDASSQGQGASEAK